MGAHNFERQETFLMMKGGENVCVLAYGSEAWVLSKSDETILGVFERKILRAIFGPTNENGE
jgi:hypothetical protein